MPHSDTVDYLLVEKKSPTKSEWTATIEGRKADLIEHVKELGQTKLGDVKHWLDFKSPHEGHYGSVGYAQTRIEHLFNSFQGVPFEGSELVEELSSRGVWIFSKASYSDEYPEYSETREVGFGKSARLKKMLVYGFTRREDWLAVEIEFILISGNVETEKKVTVRHVDLKDLLESKDSGGYGLKPKDIWISLSKVVENHVQQRRQLLKKAEELWSRIKFEDDVMLVLTSKSETQ